MIAKRPLGIVFVAMALLCSWAGASFGIDASDRKFAGDTEVYLKRLEKLGFAGGVLVARNGATIFGQRFGEADREQNRPWTMESISDIGSITKQFTGAAILLLEEQHLLRTQDTITKYFKGVPPDKSSITLHQLLTHSSGMVDLDSAGDYDPIGRDEFIRRILAQPLTFEPGAGYEYTNAGYSLLGAIVEIVTGQSYEQFLRERLFLPNGMQETGYILPAWDTTRFVMGYSPDGLWGTILRKPMANDGPYWVLRANGGIHSTPNEMMRWAEALLAGKVLTPASMDQYWAAHVDEGGGTSYGYGWSIDSLANGDKVITHNGGNGIFYADMMIVPSQHVVIFIQTNIVAEMRIAASLLESVRSRLFAGEPYADIPDLADTPGSSLDVAIGSYKMGDDDSFDVRAENNRLLVSPNGKKAFAYLHSTDSVDLEKCSALNARMEPIMAALVGGDIGPMFEALNRRSPMERLQERWAEQRRMWEEEYGALKGYEIVGSAIQDERDMTLVRFTFANGTADRAYVWEKDANPNLLGYSARGLNPTLTCVPVKGGTFASWDSTTGQTRPLRVDRSEGHTYLRFGPKELAFEASR